MKKGYSHITMVIDRSGSMQEIKKATEESINGFVNQQKEVAGTATLAVLKFDFEFDWGFNKDQKDFKMEPLDKIKESFVLKPRGSTALLDAIGRAIVQTGEALAEMKEDDRPDSVIFVIVTDGEENASREFSVTKIKKMIEEQTQKYNWTFLFLGANQDAILTANEFGIGQGNAITFNASAKGVSNVISATSGYVTATRGGAQGVSYTAENRKDSMSE